MPKHIIAKRLKEAMGLHTPTVGMITISSAIKKRMRILQIDSQAEYQSTLENHSEEMKNLIEAVIIPETWFFRDAIAYKQLLKYLIKQKVSNGSNQISPIRILSIPCSSGEEPYSIAMSLTDNGFRHDEYHIDAIDISEELIQRAREGVYGKNSFRSDDVSFVKNHFSEDNERFHLSTRIKERVNFYHANLLDKDFLPGYEIYDVIFCRNLLIYFDNDTQSHVFSVLNRLLKKNGLLILGHAETSQKSSGLFEIANELGAYINRKSTRGSNKSSDKENLQPNTHHRPIVSSNIQQKIMNKNAYPDAVDEDALDDAFLLADKGDIDGAIKKILSYIKNNKFSSRAHYLLGLLHDVNGDAEVADEFLKKALYLDPNNVDALIHLSLMAEQRGDIDDSERLRNRAERVQSRNAES